MDTIKRILKWVIIGFFSLFIFIIAIVFLFGKEEPTDNSNGTNIVEEQIENTQPPAFSELSRTRLDDIVDAIEELEKIECHSTDCDKVVYFYFTTLPDDFRTLIEMNTVTFSNFKLNETGTSNVTIIARYGGQTILTCDASKGRLRGCAETQ